MGDLPPMVVVSLISLISMEYVCDKWHLEWKLRQVESALREIVAWRKMIVL